MIADLADVVERHDRILYELQQQMSSSVNVPASSAPDPNPTYETITLSDGTTTVVLDFSAATPTGVVLATGSVFNNNYVDVSWDAATDDRVHEYSVDYARKVAGVYQLEDSSGKIGGSSLRVEGLMPNTTYGFRVWGYNGLGLPSATPAWVDIATGQDNTVPAALTGLTLAAGFRSVLFQWNPSGDNDVVRGGLYRMEIATNAAFTTGVQTKLTTAYVDSFDNLVTGTQYWGRVYPIDASGNQGPVISAGPVTTAQVGTTDYGAGSVGTTQLADLAVTNAKIGALAVDDGKVNNLSAAKVTFGVMSGDRISANTLDVIALKSSSITTATLTLNGGTLRALNGTGGVGMAINSQGISIYNSAGTRTIFLDASTGAGTFAGTLSGATGTFAGSLTAASGTITGWLTTGVGGGVRTAPSGMRLELTQQYGHTLKAFTGNASESGWGGVQVVDNGIGGLAVTIFGPVTSGGPSSGQIYCWADGSVTTNTLKFTIGGHSLIGSSAWSTYASFMYDGLGANNYALLQSSTADTFVNSGNVLYLRWQNNDRMSVDGNGVGVLSNASMQQHILYLKSMGDNTHRLYWDGSDGVMLRSYSWVGTASSQWDHMCEAGHYASSTRHVNIASNAWHPSEASSHINYSDPKDKKVVRSKQSLTVKEFLAQVRRVGKPFRFTWKGQHGNPAEKNKVKFGLASVDMPEEVQARMILNDTTEGVGLDSAAVDAFLLGAIHDLMEEHDALVARVTELESAAK